MSDSYTRNLTFETQDLGTEATLMLTFDKPIDGMYNDKFPVVWKVVWFPARGPNRFPVTFSSQLAWLKPVTERGSIVGAPAYTPINYNQKTTCQQDGSGLLSFTTPETGTPNTVTVTNGTDGRQDFALGFLREGSRPAPVYYWNGIGASNSIQTNFQPVLRAYITSDSAYREGQIIQGEINSPIIFEQDLAALDNNTTWNLEYIFSTGVFSITQA